MKAIIFERCGDPSQVLEVREVPDPKPARGQVRIRMLASPINPSDLLYVRGEYGLTPRFPTTPGFEGVGIVEENGGGLLGWRVKGKRVAVLNGFGGNWQEQVILPAKFAVPLPDSLSIEQAASYFVNPATALVMTQYVLRVQKGKWLMQTAAGSALGRMVIRLGKKLGFRTLNVVRRQEQVEELKQIGADEVIVGTGPEIAEQAKSITQGEGVPYAIDAVGGATGSAVVQSLGHNGRMLVYGILSDSEMSFFSRVLMVGQKSIQGFWLSQWSRDQSIFTMLGLFRRLNRLFNEGIVTTDVGQTFAMDQIQEAARAADQPGRSGKVLLKLTSE